MQPPMPGLDGVQSITGTTRKRPSVCRVLPQGKGSGGSGEGSRDTCKLPSAAPPTQPTALTGGSWKRTSFHAWKAEASAGPWAVPGGPQECEILMVGKP